MVIDTIISADKDKPNDLGPEIIELFIFLICL